MQIFCTILLICCGKCIRICSRSWHSWWSLSLLEEKKKNRERNANRQRKKKWRGRNRKDECLPNMYTITQTTSWITLHFLKLWWNAENSNHFLDSQHNSLPLPLWLQYCSKLMINSTDYKKSWMNGCQRYASSIAKNLKHSISGVPKWSLSVTCGKCSSSKRNSSLSTSNFKDISTFLLSSWTCFTSQKDKWQSFRKRS